MSSLESNSKGVGEEENQLKVKPKIMPLHNGPYYLINDTGPKIVESLQNSKGEPLSTVRGVALCRCGASNNKPFCDGTHATIGFSTENRTVANDNNGSGYIKANRPPKHTSRY